MGAESAPAAPALGFSLTCNLDGSRQIVFQSFVPVEAPVSEINAAVDKIMAITDRQRAKYEIVDMEKELDDLSRDLKNGEENIQMAETNFRKTMAQLDVQLMELNAVIEAEQEGAAAIAAQRGQSIKAALKGRPDVNIKRARLGIDAIKEEKARKEAEKAQALDEVGRTQERRRLRISELEAKITEKKALIEGA